MEDLRGAMLKYRSINDISQSDLAKLCKVSLQSICAIENGKQKPHKKTEAKIRLVIGTGAKTREDIMNIYDAAERQAAIAENPKLFS